MSGFELYPAIDLLGGRCVRLYQGDYDRATTYGDDPGAQAAAFVEAGATWVHVVDLDAARTGSPANRGAVAAIAAVASAAGVRVQVGGGVRSVASAEALFDLGVTRVVLGTAAIEDPDLVDTLASRHPVAVGLDARGGEVAVRGWVTSSGRTVADLAHRFADVGVDALVVTDIGRDGTLDGPDVTGIATLLDEVAVPVLASGGVADLDDLRVLAELRAASDPGRGLGGAVVGRALYEGAFSVEAALGVLGSPGGGGAQA